MRFEKARQEQRRVQSLTIPVDQASHERPDEPSESAFDDRRQSILTECAPPPIRNIQSPASDSDKLYKFPTRVNQASKSTIVRRSKTFRIHDSSTVKKELLIGGLFVRDDNMLIAEKNLRQLTDKVKSLELFEQGCIVSNDQSVPYCPLNEDLILL